MLTGRPFLEVFWSQKSERSEWPIANVRSEWTRSGRGDRPIAGMCAVDEDSRPTARLSRKLKVGQRRTAQSQRMSVGNTERSEQPKADVRSEYSRSGRGDRPIAGHVRSGQRQSAHSHRLSRKMKVRQRRMAHSQRLSKCSLFLSRRKSRARVDGEGPRRTARSHGMSVGNVSLCLSRRKSRARVDSEG